MAKEKKFSTKSTTAKKSTDQQAAGPKKAIAKEVATTTPVSLPHLSTASEHATQPEPAEIRRRAYEFYCERGCQHGSHKADWHRAESELRSKYIS
jgi:hypothetical protein